MPVDLSLDWDSGNTRHIARHGITAAEVEEIFAHDPADIGFETMEGEGRWTVIGHTNSLRFLVVVWTMRGQKSHPDHSFRGGQATAGRLCCRERTLNMEESRYRRTKVSKFATEAAEARWWDRNAKMVEKELVAALRTGTAQRGTAQR